MYDVQMYIDLGEVLCAKKMFLYMRKKSREHIKESLSKMESADRAYASFYKYDDCGSFYKEMRDEAKMLYENALNNRTKFVVSSEKYFKKLKNQFIENYPAFDWLLKEQLEKVSTIE